VNASVDADQRRRSRLTLVALFLVAVLPLVASYLLFFAVRDEGPWGTTNHGELLDPLLPSTGLIAAGREGRADAPLAGSWWLLLVAQDGCDEACVAASERLKALHVLLNKDADRVRRGYHQISAEQDGAGWDRVSTADPMIERVVGELAALAQGIYVIDPLGNVVLHYDYAAAGKPVLEDLKKLLKVSQIG
jgi:cytochrome oxidase Cu insertion factor (SCO1/SenC/PrrC family)